MNQHFFVNLLSQNYPSAKTHIGNNVNPDFFALFSKDQSKVLRRGINFIVSFRSWTVNKSKLIADICLNVMPNADVSISEIFLRVKTLIHDLHIQGCG